MEPKEDSGVNAVSTSEASDETVACANEGENCSQGECETSCDTVAGAAEAAVAAEAADEHSRSSSSSVRPCPELTVGAATAGGGINLDAIKTILNLVLGMPDWLIPVVKKALESGVLIGPLATLKPWASQVLLALEFIQKLRGLQTA